MLSNKYIFQFFVHFFFGNLLLLVNTSLKAQILNDSAKNVYGTNTTLFTKEENIFTLQDSLSKIDTSLTNFHLFDLVRKNRFLYQDLGHNLGTPTKNTFYMIPQQIGVQWGVQAYESHKWQNEDIKYYDTKSPYSHFYFVQGGRGQQIAGVEFSRNIKENFNFGFQFQRTNTFRQYALSGDRTQNAILEQYNAVFWSRYFSKNKQYKLLFHYYHFSSPFKELGGVTGGTSIDTLYDYDATLAQLSDNPQSWQTYNRLHLYQEYNTDSTKNFALFHVAQYERQRDSYTDNSYTANQTFYLQNAAPSFPVNDFLNFDFAAIRDDYKLKFLLNKLGLRYRLGKIIFWGYFKRRDYSMLSHQQALYEIKGASENYAGARLQKNFVKNITLESKAEYLLGKKDYLLEINLLGKFGELGFKSYSVSPSIIANKYNSIVRTWDNQNLLKNTFTQELWLRGKLNISKFYVEPFFKYQLVDNYIYFRRENAFIFPEQARKQIQILQIGLFAKVNFKNLHFEHQIFYTKDLASSDLIRFPEWHIWGTWYYEKALFKNALFLRTGLDWHYRTAYFADAYMPTLKQYYLQNTQEVNGYLIGDIFASIRIRRTRAFLKLSHWNEGILPKPDNGYIVTPYYAGLRRTFSIGFSWQLFD